MDNLTHTLVGVLVGETIARTVPAAKTGLPGNARRNLLVGVMAVGSNFPDLDFLYSAVTGSKLDYLLQHRGHTHTIVGAVAIALLMLAVCEVWLRYRQLKPARSDRLWLIGIALLAPLLHIAMDFSNSYGVHPFWPFYNGWMYGDSVFIVEPLFWAAAAPLVFLLKTPVARVLVALVLAAGVALSFVTGLVPVPLAIALTALTIAMLAVGRCTSPRTALFAGLGVWISATLMFAAAGRVAARQTEAFAGHSESGRLLDHVLTPMPVNPVCWEIILVQSEGERYSLRQAILSLAPGWISASACPSRSFPTNVTAPLTPIEDASSASLQWRGEVVLSRSELKDLASEYCQAAGMLRFARAPFFAKHGSSWIVGDLRYDREPQAGFAEFELGKDRCPSFVPEWIPPRADLLQ